MKRYCSFILILMAAMLMFLMAGCVSTQKTAPVEQQPEAEKPPALPVEQQEQLAMNTFEEMLELTADRPKWDVLPELEAGYYKIIEEAPDTYLAEESHFRLMIHYFEDFPKPQPEKGEEIYRLYFERYKKPQMALAMNATLARLYFNYHYWDRLSKFMVPFVKKYVETGKIDDTLFLFYYSEAKFHIKDYEEAERGFKLMIHEKFPNVELGLAHRRLEEIRNLKNPNMMKEEKEQ